VKNGRFPGKQVSGPIYSTCFHFAPVEKPGFSTAKRCYTQAGVESGFVPVAGSHCLSDKVYNLQSKLYPVYNKKLAFLAV
jgi:protein tyrosine phosphatase (PTP) superfamily phosphohydrolase (DUF442 family)